MAAVVCRLRGPRETFPLFYGANIHFPHTPGRDGQEGGRKETEGGKWGVGIDLLSLLIRKCTRRHKSPDVTADGRNNGFHILEERH